MSARVPAVLEEKYEFEFDVGQWTYGTISVYKHIGLDKLRTCKTVPKALVRNTGTELRLLKHLRQLTHGHICSVTDALEDKNNYYIMSEYLQGGELSDWAERLDDNYVIQEQTCAAYMREALIAMVHAHSFQVHHGSLLPSSISLSSKMPDAYAKISDFGLSSILDPDNTVLQRNRSPYTAPEILSGEAPFIDSSSDMYSIGAITHALLVGRAPSANLEAAGFFSRMTGRAADLEVAWSERSSLSRDFVRKLVAPWDERLTPAQALQHPWLKGVQPISCNIKEKVTDVSKDIRHKMLCYSLAILLVPVTLPFRDFEKLTQAFAATDKDEDGLIPRQHARQILRQRCPLKEAVDHALAIADVHRADVFDLCSCACADLIAREFFGNGPTHQPLQGPFGSTDLAPRMLKKFFEVFGGRQQSITLTGLKARLRTATKAEVENHAGVDYEELMSEFPDGAIDAQCLTSLISANACRGTPLGNEEMPSKSSSAGLFAGGFLGLFGPCMTPNIGEDSPF
jgi:hypothetical protein